MERTRCLFDIVIFSIFKLHFQKELCKVSDVLQKLSCAFENVEN